MVETEGAEVVGYIAEDEGLTSRTGASSMAKQTVTPTCTAAAVAVFQWAVGVVVVAV